MSSQLSASCLFKASHTHTAACEHQSSPRLLTDNSRTFVQVQAADGNKSPNIGFYVPRNLLSGIESLVQREENNGPEKSIARIVSIDGDIINTEFAIQLSKPSAVTQVVPSVVFESSETPTTATQNALDLADKYCSRSVVVGRAFAPRTLIEDNNIVLEFPVTTKTVDIRTMHRPCRVTYRAINECHESMSRAQLALALQAERLMNARRAPQVIPTVPDSADEPFVEYDEANHIGNHQPLRVSPTRSSGNMPTEDNAYVVLSDEEHPQHSPNSTSSEDEEEAAAVLSRLDENSDPESHMDPYEGPTEIYSDPEETPQMDQTSPIASEVMESTAMSQFDTWVDEHTRVSHRPASTVNRHRFNWKLINPSDPRLNGTPVMDLLRDDQDSSESEEETVSPSSPSRANEIPAPQNETPGPSFTSYYSQDELSDDVSSPLESEHQSNTLVPVPFTSYVPCSPQYTLWSGDDAADVPYSPITSPAMTACSPCSPYITPYSPTRADLDSPQVTPYSPTGTHLDEYSPTSPSNSVQDDYSPTSPSQCVFDHYIPAPPQQSVLPALPAVQEDEVPPLATSANKRTAAEITEAVEEDDSVAWEVVRYHLMFMFNYLLAEWAPTVMSLAVFNEKWRATNHWKAVRAPPPNAPAGYVSVIWKMSFVSLDDITSARNRNRHINAPKTHTTKSVPQCYIDTLPLAERAMEFPFFRHLPGHDDNCYCYLEQ